MAAVTYPDDVGSYPVSPGIGGGGGGSSFPTYTNSFFSPPGSPTAGQTWIRPEQPGLVLGWDADADAWVVDGLPEVLAVLNPNTAIPNGSLSEVELWNVAAGSVISTSSVSSYVGYTVLIPSGGNVGLYIVQAQPDAWIQLVNPPLTVMIPVAAAGFGQVFVYNGGGFTLMSDPILHPTVIVGDGSTTNTLPNGAGRYDVQTDAGNPLLALPDASAQGVGADIELRGWASDGSTGVVEINVNGTDYDLRPGWILRIWAHADIWYVAAQTPAVAVD